MISNRIWFNVFRRLHVSHHGRKDNIKTNLRKHVANILRNVPHCRYLITETDNAESIESQNVI